MSDPMVWGGSKIDRIRRIDTAMKARNGKYAELLLHWIADGGTVKSFFDEANDDSPLPKRQRQYCEASGFYRWIRRKPQQAYREAYEEAKEVSSHALVDMGLDLIEKTTDPSKSNLVYQKTNFWKWLASKRNRADYGDDKANVNVQVNLNQLHLEALEQLAPKPAGEILPDTPQSPEIGPERQKALPAGEGPSEPE